MGKYLASPSPDSIIFAASLFLSIFLQKRKGEIESIPINSDTGYIIPDVINSKSLSTDDKNFGREKCSETWIPFARLLKKVLGKLPVEGVKGKLIPLRKRKFGSVGKQSGGDPPP